MRINLVEQTPKTACSVRNYCELVKKRLRYVMLHSPAREFNVGRFLAPKFYASIYNWNYSVVVGGLFQTVPANYSQYSYSSSFPRDSLWEDFVPTHNEIVSLHSVHPSSTSLVRHDATTGFLYYLPPVVPLLRLIVCSMTLANTRRTPSAEIVASDGRQRKFNNTSFNVFFIANSLQISVRRLL